MSRVFLTNEQAKSVLTDYPHSWMPSSSLRLMIGADLTTDQAHKLIDESVAIELTGERARRLGYGIMIYSPDQTGRGLRTDEAKLAALESELIASGREHDGAPQWWKDGKEQPANTEGG